MKIYYIKIIPNSIEKNKDAGETVSYLAGRKEVRFITVNLPDYFIDGKNCIITEREFQGDEIIRCSGFITSNELAQTIIQEKPVGLRIEINNELQRIEHPPIPEYSYEYENIQIRCNNCRRKIYLDDLESDSFEDCYSDLICPKCGAWGCCELKYEKIDDTVKQLKI